MAYQKLKVGVVGVGRMGEYHLQKYLNIKNIEFIGIYEPNLNRAIEIKEKYNVHCFKDLSSLLFAADAISLTCPTISHYSILKQAILSHVHVLVEKPACSTVKEAEEIATLAKKENIIVGVGHVERFRLLEFLKHSPLTDIYYLDASRFSSSLPREKIDVISDLMIHDIDMILYLMQSEPSLVSAVGIIHHNNLIDIANARLDFKKLASANITVNRLSDINCRELRLFTREKHVSFNFVTNEIKEILYYKNERRSFNISVDPIKLECEDFIDSIKLTKKPLVSINEVISSLKILEQIRDIINTTNSYKITNRTWNYLSS